jgi:hypothetical protein
MLLQLALPGYAHASIFAIPDGPAVADFEAMQEKIRNEYVFFTGRKTSCEEKLDNGLLDAASRPTPGHRDGILEEFISTFEDNFGKCTVPVPDALRSVLEKQHKRGALDDIQFRTASQAVDDCEATNETEGEKWSRNLCLKNSVVSTYLCPLRKRHNDGPTEKVAWSNPASNSANTGSAECKLWPVIKQKGSAYDSYTEMRTKCLDNYAYLPTYKRECIRWLEKIYKRSENSKDLETNLTWLQNEYDNLAYLAEGYPFLVKVAKEYSDLDEQDLADYDTALFSECVSAGLLPEEVSMCMHNVTLRFLNMVVTFPREWNVRKYCKANDCPFME